MKYYKLFRKLKNNEITSLYNFTEFKRPLSQGGLWYLAKRIKILKPYEKSMEEELDKLEEELDIFKQETLIIISEHLEEFESYKFNNDKYKATNSLDKITQKKWGTKLCLCMVEEYFNGKIKNYGTHDN